MCIRDRCNLYITFEYSNLETDIGILRKNFAKFVGLGNDSTAATKLSLAMPTLAKERKLLHKSNQATSQEGGNDDDDQIVNSRSLSTINTMLESWLGVFQPTVNTSRPMIHCRREGDR